MRYTARSSDNGLLTQRVPVKRARASVFRFISLPPTPQRTIACSLIWLLLTVIHGPARRAICSRAPHTSTPIVYRVCLLPRSPVNCSRRALAARNQGLTLLGERAAQMLLELCWSRLPRRSSCGVSDCSSRCVWFCGEVKRLADERTMKVVPLPLPLPRLSPTRSDSTRLARLLYCSSATPRLPSSVPARRSLIPQLTRLPVSVALCLFSS